MDLLKEERWLSASEVCSYLSVSNDTLYRWIQQKEFPAQKIGTRWKAQKHQVDAWILSRFSSQNSSHHISSRAVNNTAAPWRIFDYPLRKENECRFTHVSLFTGCGGIDLGFRQAGFKTIFANDINADACDTYSKNLGPIIEGDIRKLDIPDINSVDVVSAGFPCQPFSNAGLRKGVNDSRGSLFLSALHVVEKLQPRIVMFENVRGLLSSRHEGRLLIEIICENLNELGYTPTFSLVDASKHNVPQKRLRVIIIGVKRQPENGQFFFPPVVIRDDLSLKHVVIDIPDSVPNQKELMQLNPQALKIGAMVPEGGSWKDIPYDKLPDRLKRISDNIKRYRWPKFYRRFHRDEVAGTITAAFKPENAGVWHPTEQRIFSVREIARIQTFPDWFGFHGKNIKSKYQQIGNAVPPRLAYEIALQIIKVLDGENIIPGSPPILFSEFVGKGRPIRACDHNIIYR